MGGKKANALGKQFETLIDYACTRYAHEGLAIIQKTPEPFKVLRRIESNQFIGAFEKKGQVDYCGVCEGGRAIYFEAKHFLGTSFPFTRLQAHQEEMLVKVHKTGGEAFLLLSHECQDFYKVPIDWWVKNKTMTDKKSINVKELERFRIPTQGTFIKFLEQKGA